ncbi:type II toxin-antitoxin system RelE/ParE family toxin [Lutibacter aestuarii]|uniref:Type II toxin-antitoxin system RelE/ParE family toxin n=1 Tax=Lutibacter aestuarii TaxID=861111 RepID=A0ABW2Z210_9FLAO
MRIHHYRIRTFGETQADDYFNFFFEYFDRISKSPYSFESVDYIRIGYRKCVCGSDSIYFKINENDKVVEIIAIIRRQDLKNLL